MTQADRPQRLITDGGEVIDIPAPGFDCEDYYVVGMGVQWFACEECGRPSWEHRGEQVLDRDAGFPFVYRHEDYSPEMKRSLERRWSVALINRAAGRPYWQSAVPAGTAS